MLRQVITEIKGLWQGLKALDRQTTAVLIIAAVLGMWKYTFGGNRFFRDEIAELAGVDGRGIWSYVYLFGGQGITGFILPVLVLVLIFKCKPGKIGLGLGDWKLALTLMGLYLPVVSIGCWILSAQASFQRKYPLFDAASEEWHLFLVFELLFLFYWVGWEYLWRGFVLFGTAHTFGAWAIFIQMLPFAALHAQKPAAEAYLSILGGLVLGAVVWRCKSFWIAVPIHSFQMLAMDFCCTIRERSHVGDGIGFDALSDALSGSFG